MNQPTKLEVKTLRATTIWKGDSKMGSNREKFNIAIAILNRLPFLRVPIIFSPTLCVLWFFTMQPKLKFAKVTLFWCQTCRAKLKKGW